jgi:Zn-dependent protease with chaperone function
MRTRAAYLGPLILLLLPAAATPPRGAVPAGPDSSAHAARLVPGTATVAPRPAGSDSSAMTTAPAADSLPADTAAAAALAPPRDLLAEVHANFTPENRAYSHTRVVLDFIEPIYAVLLCLLLLFSGASARMRDIAGGFGHRRYVLVLVYFTLFTLVTFLLTLPFSWYRGFALEHQYGLSTQAFGPWLTDELKGEGFTILCFAVIPLVALGYRAIEKFPRTWWLWLGVGSVPVVVAATLLSPLVFEPAFNKFTPLRDVALREQILDLAGRAGIPGRRVYEVDRSAQTKKFNAYVSGFGASQRIVLWDTTLKGMEHDEILFVMGHEMGHYKLGHIWKGIAFNAGLSLVLFFLAGFLTRAALRRFGAQWAIRELHDIASLPLMFAVLTVLSTLALPAVSGFSRGIEHEADVFGLEITRTNDAAARAFLKLGTQNRSDPEPTPFVRAMLYDHPPLGERIRFALEYHPWEQGRPSRFYRPGQ